jgi:hypothetical protein
MPAAECNNVEFPLILPPPGCLEPFLDVDCGPGMLGIRVLEHLQYCFLFRKSVCKQLPTYGKLDSSDLSWTALSQVATILTESYCCTGRVHGWRSETVGDRCAAEAAKGSNYFALRGCQSAEPQYELEYDREMKFTSIRAIASF